VDKINVDPTEQWLSTGAKEDCSANCTWITVFKYIWVKVTHELRGLEEELGKDAVCHHLFNRWIHCRTKELLEGFGHLKI
jgi:hypothetical protein